MARPSRGAAKVVYREVDSDDSDCDYEGSREKDMEDDDYSPAEEVVRVVKVTALPPLSPLQSQFRQVCRLGDKGRLKQFLTDNPGLEMDVKDPDGVTVLNEAVTKTAQFSGIVEVLLDSGSSLDVADSLGNTPLHNAVLYHPSTQETVDLLLQRGADPKAKNYEGNTPVVMADDKDLKEVLKELKKVKKKKGMPAPSINSLYSEQLRRRVFDQSRIWSPEHIKVKFNGPIAIPASPGLLKKKRKREELDDCADNGDFLEDSFTKPERKRIRWKEEDSTGASIDPKFSDDESDSSKGSFDHSFRDIGETPNSVESTTDEDEVQIIDSDSVSEFTNFSATSNDSGTSKVEPFRNVKVEYNKIVSNEPKKSENSEVTVAEIDTYEVESPKNADLGITILRDPRTDKDSKLHSLSRQKIVNLEEKPGSQKNEEPKLSVIIDKQTEAHLSQLDEHPQAPSCSLGKQSDATSLVDYQTKSSPPVDKSPLVRQHQEGATLNVVEKSTEATTHMKDKHTEVTSLLLIKQPKMQSFFSVIQPKANYPIFDKMSKTSNKSICPSADKMEDVSKKSTFPSTDTILKGPSKFTQPMLAFEMPGKAHSHLTDNKLKPTSSAVIKRLEVDEVKKDPSKYEKKKDGNGVKNESCDDKVSKLDHVDGRQERIEEKVVEPVVTKTRVVNFSQGFGFFVA